MRRFLYSAAAVLLLAAPLPAQETQKSPETQAAAETQAAETRPAAAPTPPPPPSQDSWWDTNFRIAGDFRLETAARLSPPRNLSKLKGIARIDLKFVFNDHYKVKIGGRIWADGAYNLTDQYPKPVVENMRKEILLRDAYLDITYPYINMRFGHQQIVWGEALGQFFADVVTPKDFREFILQNFEEMRLPVWAFDFQVTPFPDFTIEAVASPDQQVHKLALQGADFAFDVPPTAGIESVLQPDDRPRTNFKRWNAGLRFSYLVSGWDLSAFYYTSPDHAPALRKVLSNDPFTGNPILFLDPVHRRVHHAAATFSKGFDAFVVRGEMVYTMRRFFDSTVPTASEGLVSSDLLRYVLGLDYDIGGRVLLNAEFQQEAVTRRRDRVADDTLRSWFFLRAHSSLLNDKLEPELSFIVGLDGGDMMIRPKLTWNANEMITVSTGFDLFTGPDDQLYGRFDDQDRFYVNAQWRF